MQLNCTHWIVDNDVLIERCTAVTHTYTKHITVDVVVAFTKHVVFVYFTHLIFFWIYSACILEHTKPIWRDRYIDLLRSYSNQMHELDFSRSLSFSALLISLDACSYRLTSHFHCSTFDFRYVLHVCVCVCRS